MRGLFCTLFLTSIFFGAFAAPAADRDIQIRSVDFETSVLELYNLGTGTVSLTGWRFCSHDDNEVRRYSSTTGLNNQSIAPGSSLYIHFLNDAPAGTNHLNRSSVGAFALPLDRGPFGIQIYHQTPFGTGTNIADHIQWNIDGVDNVTADERSDEAQAGGVWVDQTRWVETRPTTRLLALTDESGGVLHQPEDYAAVEPEVLGWWRFDHAEGIVHRDIATRFAAGSLVGAETNWVEAPAAQLFDDGQDVFNHAARRQPIFLAPVPLLDPPVTTNEWTVEVNHFFPVGGEFISFFHVDERNSVGTTNSSILVGWVIDGDAQLRAWIRDEDNGSSSEEFHNLGAVPADDAWHHVAVVKRGTMLEGYLDYQQIGTAALGATGGGDFAFSTNHNATVGIALNNASSSGPDNVIDEVRVTMKALAPAAFLQSAAARIIELPLSLGDPQWTFGVQANTGEFYRVESKSTIETEVWNTINTFTATGVIHNVTIPARPEARPVLRVSRDP